MKKDIEELIKYSKTLKVLVVEDNDEARKQALKLLSNLFDNIVIAIDGVDGLEKFKADKFDLIITDINMPNMDGIQMCSQIRKTNKDIPIIILSAYNDTKYFMETIKLNINGYILKPINMQQFLDALHDTIERIKLRNEVYLYKLELETVNNNLHILNEDLESQVMERISEIYSLNKEIEETQKEVVFTMGAIGERRSQETGNHVKRVAQYSKIFAIYYGLSEDEAEMLKQASPMHDIGKVAIADSILNKPGRFTDEEFKIMTKHSLLGYEMLKGSKRPLLNLAATIAYQHHEKWNGSGYPRGLKGDEIDINGRITAIADVFDALGSSRVYKEAWSDEKIFKLFKEERGKHFDPELVDIFFNNLDEFLNIRNSLKDI